METTQSPAKLTPDSTLAHLKSVNPKAAEMLASIGLDPAKHKGETLRAACKQRQWSEVEVLQWIKKHASDRDKSGVGEDAGREPDFGDDVVKWCEYIEEHVHVSTLELLNEISRNFSRVCQIHGNQYPWLKNMKWYFEEFDDAFRLYLTFENEKFFKLIKKWNKHSGDILDGTIREMKRCANIVRQDQKRLQNYMDGLRDKANGFESPKGACSTLRILIQNFKMLYSGLDKQFEIERETLLPMIKKKIGSE